MKEKGDALSKSRRNILDSFAWDMAVSLALLESFDHQVKPGERLHESIDRVGARAREIYKAATTREPAKP